jgi:hypothetical protein
MYIDPNTGGMLFQICAALFGIFSATILIFSGRIRKMFAMFRRTLFNRTKTETETIASDHDTSPPNT